MGKKDEELFNQPALLCLYPPDSPSAVARYSVLHIHIACNQIHVLPANPHLSSKPLDAPIHTRKVTRDEGRRCARVWIATDQEVRVPNDVSNLAGNGSCDGVNDHILAIFELVWTVGMLPDEIEALVPCGIDDVGDYAVIGPQVVEKLEQEEAGHLLWAVLWERLGVSEAYGSRFSNRTLTAGFTGLKLPVVAFVGSWRRAFWIELGLLEVLWREEVDTMGQGHFVLALAVFERCHFGGGCSVVHNLGELKSGCRLATEEDDGEWIAR